MSNRNRKKAKKAPTTPRREITVEEKQRWFGMYAEKRKEDPNYTIAQFCASLTGEEPPSAATMSRCVHMGLEQKWPGWEEIKGRCLRHPKILLDDKQQCEQCQAEAIIKLRDPKGYARMLAEKALPLLKETDPLKKFIASDVPVSQFVSFFVDGHPHASDPECHVRPTHKKPAP